MKFKIYTKTNCTFCDQAKALLSQKKFEYDIINIEGPYFDKQELVTKIAPGAKTVPIVFANGSWIGGFTELKRFIELWDADIAKLRALLDSGETVTVIFIKQDGTQRTMHCTTNQVFIPANKIPGQQAPVEGSWIFTPPAPPIVKNTNPYLFKVFDLTKQEWRSFNAQSILRIV